MLSQTHHDLKSNGDRGDFVLGQRGTDESECFLLIPSGDGKRSAFALQGSDFILIGRHQMNTITLNDPKCSRIHCELSRANDQRWTIRDMNSTNGTFVNERRLTCEHRLTDGDVIQVGDMELVFVIIPPTAAY